MLINYKDFFPIGMNYDFDLFQSDTGFNICEAIENLPNEKKDFIVNLLMKGVVNFANEFFKVNNEKRAVVYQTSLKEYFIHTVEINIRTNIYDDNNKTSNLAIKKGIYYNLNILNQIFNKPHPTYYDLHIKRKLLKAIKNGKQYVLDIGIELNIEKIKKMKQLVFTIFEEKAISGQ